MRDIDSIQIALTMAETGHLVFATLHTNDAPQAIDRIIDVFPAWRQEQTRVQLASSLSAIIAQRLIPRIGGGIGRGLRGIDRYESSPQPHSRRSIEPTSERHVHQYQRDDDDALKAALATLIVEGVIAYEDAMSVTAHPKELIRTLEQMENNSRER